MSECDFEVDSRYVLCCGSTYDTESPIMNYKSNFCQGQSIISKVSCPGKSCLLRESLIRGESHDSPIITPLCVI